jgi:hypothetical protein
MVKFLFSSAQISCFPSVSSSFRVVAFVPRSAVIFGPCTQSGDPSAELFFFAGAKPLPSSIPM